MRLFLILLIIVINYITNVYSNEYLYAVTKNFKDSNIDIFIGDGINGTSYNHSITLPYDLQVQGVGTINFTTNIIALFCTRQANGEDYSSLVAIDVKSGEVIDVSNYIAKPLNQVLNNGVSLQNYLFGHHGIHKNQVYLPSTILNSNGLNLVHWNFQSSNQLANIYSIVDTFDIDTSVQPQGTLEFNGNIIVVYHSKSNPTNIVNIVRLDFNGTDSESSESAELIPFESSEIDLGFGDTVQIINYIYSDFAGSVYIAMNNQPVCQVDFITKTCNFIYTSFYESQYYPSFFQSQDKQTIITITSPSNVPVQLLQPLTMSIWNLNLSGGDSFSITNYYTKPNTYTFLVV